MVFGLQKKQKEIMWIGCPKNLENYSMSILSSRKQKKQILQNVKKLKGTGIVINQDLIIKKSKQTKYLKKHLDQRRELRKKSNIKTNNKLIVGDEEYSREQFKK